MMILQKEILKNDIPNVQINDCIQIYNNNNSNRELLKDNNNNNNKSSCDKNNND